MRVLIHLKACYDQAPVPPEVEITESDIASGRVKPNKHQNGYTVQVTREFKTHHALPIPEAELIGRLVYECIPRPGLRKLGPVNRHQLVSELIDQNIAPQHFHPSHITGFEVECDEGPDEALCRKMLAPYTEAKHHITGEPLIDPKGIDAIVAKYMEPTTHESHVSHLHARFGVAKPS